MGLESIIRSGVKIANSVTKSLQVRVSYQPWTATDEYGASTYGTVQYLTALVEQKVQERKLTDGRLVMVRATITLLSPVAANGATGRVEPIDPRDLFTLPDGTTGPIVDISGFIDAGTDKPFFSQVWLG